MKQIIILAAVIIINKCLCVQSLSRSSVNVSETSPDLILLHVVSYLHE